MRRFATEKKTSSVAFGEDGKHEIWRDGIYDHDNEPQVNQCHIIAAELIVLLLFLMYSTFLYL